jgi:F-type H+-transporting ATPase subunit delta
MSGRKKTNALARQLFKLSLKDGRLSPEHVTGVLQWVEKHRPPATVALLRAYRHLVATELARHQAVIEFAGDVAPAVFQEIADAMARRYGHPVQARPVARPDLIAGVRVRVGCDIYENSILSDLAALHPSA